MVRSMGGIGPASKAFGSKFPRLTEIKQTNLGLAHRRAVTWLGYENLLSASILYKHSSEH